MRLLPAGLVAVTLVVGTACGRIESNPLDSLPGDGGATSGATSVTGGTSSLGGTSSGTGGATSSVGGSASGTSGTGSAGFGGGSGAEGGGDVGGAGGSAAGEAGSGPSDGGEPGAAGTSGAGGGEAGSGGEAGAAAGGTTGGQGGNGGSGGVAGEGAAAGAGGAPDTDPPPLGCVLRVAPNGNDAHDGLGWATAKATIQAAVDAAPVTDICQIWIAEGTYVPRPASGGDARAATLRLRDRIELYGAFTGNELSLAARSGSAAATIVSGEIGSSSAADNVRNVVTTTGHTRIDSLTIRGGYTETRGGGVWCRNGRLELHGVRLAENHAHRAGGALALEDTCDAVVSDSSFEQNSAGTPSADFAWGGAIANLGGDLTVTASRFDDNRALGLSLGGAVFNAGAALFEDSSFSANSVQASGGETIGGGGIYGNGAATTSVVGCKFESNIAGDAGLPGSGHGAAIAGYDFDILDSEFVNNRVAGTGPGGGALTIGGEVRIDDSVFASNTVGPDGSLGRGGAIEASQANVLIRRVIFQANRAMRGGAFVCTGDCRAVVSARFEANLAFGSAPNNGDSGAIYFDGTQLDVVNSSFRDNAARRRGATMRLLRGAATLSSSTVYAPANFGTSNVDHESGTLKVSNSVVWGETTHAAIVTQQPQNLSVRFSDVMLGTFDVALGNLQVDPLLTTNAPELELSPSSPCVDRGNVAALPADALDLDDDGDMTEPLPLDLAGGVRVRGATVDLGAFER